MLCRVLLICFIVIEGLSWSVVWVMLFIISMEFVEVSFFDQWVGGMNCVESSMYIGVEMDSFVVMVLWLVRIVCSYFVYIVIVCMGCYVVLIFIGLLGLVIFCCVCV